MAARALPWAEGMGRHERSFLVWAEFSAIYEQCLPVVARYVLARVHDRQLAEDLTGDVFERAMRGWPTFRHRSAACTWILGIARHVIADHWRQSSRQPLSLDALQMSPVAGAESAPESQVQKRDEAEHLKRAIAQLSEEEQDLLALRYAAELPFGEIASLLGKREGTIRVRVHRALGRLRGVLEEEM